MIARRLAALASVGLMALLAPSLVRAAADPTPTRPSTNAQAAGASLAVSPSTGYAGDPFSASYAYGQSCPPGAQAALLWDGQSIAVTRPGSKRCTAAFHNEVPPQGDTQPGDHTVLAELVTCSSAQSCSPVAGSEASTSHTILARRAPPPTAPPSDPPATDPPVTAPPHPVATEAPTATGTPATPRPTPTATPLSIPAGGATFAPYNCRNGIPDSTPCPTPAGAVAAAAAEPSAPASPPPVVDTGGLPGRTIGVAAGGLGILLAVTIAVAIRQGAGGRNRRRRLPPPSAPRAQGF